MFATFLIGLREGLEAAVIVSILLAALTRLGRDDLRGSVWRGVALAITASVGTGAALQVTSTELSDRSQEAFAGFMSVTAVGLVTWMIFWMTRHARVLKSQLDGEVDRAVLGGGSTLGLIAFVAVIREGLETALFLWSGAVSTGDGSVGAPLIGAFLGLFAACAVGVLLYRGAIQFDLPRLFRWSAGALVVIAAGVFSYAAGEFSELGWIPGGESIAFDVSGIIAPDGLLAEVLRGFFNFRPVTSWPVFLAWIGYLVPVMVLFARTVRPKQPVRV